MKIFLVLFGIIFALLSAFQIYTIMAIGKTETQAYNVIRVEKQFEVRYYPAAMMAKTYSTLKSYRDLGSFGFRKLAKYIFGGNSEKKQIAMTSPVHMEIGDSVSTMAFVLPAQFIKEDLPKPNSADIEIQTSEPEYVAAIRFSGFATTASINQQAAILENALKAKGISYYGNFRYLGYNPPYQLFGRRNEVIVSLRADNFNK